MNQWRTNSTCFTLAVFMAFFLTPSDCYPANEVILTKGVDDPNFDQILNRYFNANDVIAAKNHLNRHLAAQNRKLHGVKVNLEESQEAMQSDQPTTGENSGVHVNPEYINARNNAMRDNWLEVIKQQILNHTGHQENSTPKINDTSTLERLNNSKVFKVFNSTPNDEQMNVSEKIRSFYPSCDSPRNTDEEIWSNETSLNLYFNISIEDSVKIASAFLRLYRLSNGTSTNKLDSEGCDISEDRLLRVSVYWYTKPLRKNNRSKRRLADSRVINESDKWVELTIRPALKAWAKGRNKNLGLSVEVEDQDVNLLKAADFFKGASCMVGVSTPKPIPTVVLDAARKSEPPRPTIDRNSSTTVDEDHLLLPTLDICYTDDPGRPCGIPRSLEERPAKIDGKLARDDDKDVEMKRRIRHLRHQLMRGEDIRSRMENATIVIPRHKLLNFTANANR